MPKPKINRPTARVPASEGEAAYLACNPTAYRQGDRVELLYDGLVKYRNKRLPADKHWVPAPDVAPNSLPVPAVYRYTSFEWKAAFEQGMQRDQQWYDRLLAMRNGGSNVAQALSPKLPNVQESGVRSSLPKPPTPNADRLLPQPVSAERAGEAKLAPLGRTGVDVSGKRQKYFGYGITAVVCQLAVKGLDNDQIFESLSKIGLTPNESSIAPWASKARKGKLPDNVSAAELTEEQLQPLFDAAGYSDKPKTSGKPKIKRK